MGVREVVLIGLLAPALGAGGAVALSVASRILLTLTEVAAPLGALLISGKYPKIGENRSKSITPQSTGLTYYFD